METKKPKKASNSKKTPRLTRLGVPVKNAAGRKPSVKAVQDKIFECLRNGNTKRTAAILGGIQESTFYDWYNIGLKAIEDGYENEYSEFSKGVDQAISDMKAYVLHCWRKGMDKDWRAALAYAERTDPEFHLKQKVETTQKIEVTQKALLEVPENGRRKKKAQAE